VCSSDLKVDKSNSQDMNSLFVKNAVLTGVNFAYNVRDYVLTDGCQITALDITMDKQDYPTTTTSA
jgi:hypothetical protein